jgi:Fe-Mn family superoxide dismutase
MSNLSLRLIPSNLRRSCFVLDGIKSRTRNVHKVPSLQYPIEEGLGNFLPPLALKTVVEYQQGLLDRLNEEVKGSW